MKTALITGASGLLGQQVNRLLIEQGYKTIGLRHHKPTGTVMELTSLDSLKQLANTTLDLVINLAGLPIAGALWTTSRKQALIESRASFTKQLVLALKNNDIRVTHFISGSAIGFYGTGSHRVNEQTSAGSDFSAQLCVQWEAAAESAKAISDTTTIIRTGLVLSKQGGYLMPLKLTSQFGVGSVFGTGQQGQSWVHQTDWLHALKFIIEHKKPGIFNLTAPNPVSQRDLMRSLTKALKRPLLFKIPSFALSVAGEMKTLFLDGQFVLPTELEAAGFKFKFSEIDQAMTDLVGKGHL